MNRSREKINEETKGEKLNNMKSIFDACNNERFKSSKYHITWVLCKLCVTIAVDS